MAKPPKRRLHSSRVTPKGTVSQDQFKKEPASLASSIRSNQARGPSPRWVTVLLFSLLGLGAVIIIINYLGYVPGGDASNIYLIVGLGFILAGMITATQLR